MGNHRHLIGFGQRVDLLRGRDAADPVGVVLDHADRLRIQQLPEAEKRELVLAARDRDRPGIQLGIAVDVVGDHRLFQPARLVSLKLGDDALRVVQVPAHVGLEHQVAVEADDLAQGLDPFEVLPDARGAVLRAVAEARLEHREALVEPFLCLALHGTDVVGIEFRVVAGDGVLGRSAEQLEDRLAGDLAHQVPDGDVDGGNRRHADAPASPGMGDAVHLFPEIGVVEGIVAQDQRRQVPVDRLLDQRRAKRGVADPDPPVVAFDLADQPLVEAEGAHLVAPGRAQVRQRVRSVGAEVRLRRPGRAGPFIELGPDGLDLCHIARRLSFIGRRSRPAPGK